jgi:hypothetical protein
MRPDAVVTHSTEYPVKPAEADADASNAHETHNATEGVVMVFLLFPEQDVLKRRDCRSARGGFAPTA